MKPDKEEYLFRSYPIFDRFNERFRTGFNCEDGWFDLIEDMVCWLSVGNFRGLKIIGIKEKFGRMIVDFECPNEDLVFISDFFSEYHNDSASVCERCGAEKDSDSDHCKPMNAFHPRK